MACLEHQCKVCGEHVFNNDPDPGYCPKCHSYCWVTWCDEKFDVHDGDYWVEEPEHIGNEQPFRDAEDE